MIENALLKYSIGALLYSPALNEKLANSIIQEKFDKPFSMAICLEDTIADESVGQAEDQLGVTLKKLNNASKTSSFYMPKLFIRVRSGGQMMRLFHRYEPLLDIVVGFIFPKYSLESADSYNEATRKINSISKKAFYVMPILESGDIIEHSTRNLVLARIKEKIDSVKEYVLNVRVGGNDFSNHFALRRHEDETIYDILPIAAILGDILTVFSREYVVSGPVWEFFDGEDEGWKKGLIREIKYDKLNGFVGKTVIHPKQIKVVNDAMKVSKEDAEDAKKILEWESSGLQVGKSFGGKRMNEVKTHYQWAKKTMLLAEAYGIEEE